MGQLSDWLAMPLPWAGSVATLCWSLLAGLLVYGALMTLRWLLKRRLQQSGGALSTELFQHGISHTRHLLIALLSITVSLRVLPLPIEVSSAIHQIQWILLALQGLTWTDLLAKFGAIAITRAIGDGKGRFPGLELGIKLVLWLLLGIATLDNLGMNVSSLLTGLGIGGVAIALAAQRVIGDLLSTVTIAMDRPFVEGDFITVGEVSGQVLRIGMKTTRLRAPSGAELIIPNADLVTQKVWNHSRLDGRHLSLVLPLPWSVSPASMEALAAEVPAIFEDLPGLKLVHALVTGTTETGYSFEVAYTMEDVGKHYPLQQALALSLSRLLERLQIKPAGRTTIPLP